MQMTADTSFTATAAPVKASVYHLGPGVYVTNIEIVITVVALALTIGFALGIQRSQLGRAMRAIAYDAPTSGLMSISEGRMSALARWRSLYVACSAAMTLASRSLVVDQEDVVVRVPACQTRTT